jgi:hypothetical protein
LPSRLGRVNAWNASFWACCCILIAPLWVTGLPPLVDLPQHAGLLATGVRWPNQGFPYAEYFEVNWIANSLLPYALSYALALTFPVVVALKLVLCLGLLGIPLATRQLVRTVGGDEWWVFASFPVAYGYAFMWGFIPFVVGAPLGLLLIDVAIRYRNSPSPSRAWALAGLACLLFASHVLVLAYAGLVSAIIVASASTWRARVFGAFGLAAVLPLVAAWWAATVALTPNTTPISTPLLLGYGPTRISELFGFTVGSLEVTPADVLLAYLVISTPFLLGARFTSKWWRYAPLAVCVTFFLSIPMHVLGTGYVYPRFTLFLVPSLLVALEPARRRSRPAQVGAVGLAVLSLVLVAERFHAFGVESRGVISLLARIEPNRRILSLIDDPSSTATSGVPYLHIGSWYQVESGGIADFSFAEFFPNRFRYRAGMDPPLPYNVEWQPGAFDWKTHGGRLYDYFLIRGDDLDPFRGATTHIELVGREGPWAVYRQTNPTP